MRRQASRWAGPCSPRESPLLVLFWFGVLAYGAVCGVWCATMIAAMLALMLYRRSEYLHGNMR
jgi:hypothetical protein